MRQVRALRWREQLGTLQHRLQDYLTELTINGQWVWDEAAVLRQFLQIPITSEKRQAPTLIGPHQPWALPLCPALTGPGQRAWFGQAREVLMKDIQTYKLRQARAEPLDKNSRQGRASARACAVAMARLRCTQWPHVLRPCR